MRWRTVKVAAGAAIAALFVYGGTVQAADTAVPAPGQSKKIDEIKKRGTLLAATDECYRIASANISPIAMLCKLRRAIGLLEVTLPQTSDCRRYRGRDPASG